MSKLKLLIFSALILIPNFHYGQHTDQINSNRPGETMSAFSVGKSVFQVETGIYGITEKHDLLNYDANGFGVDMTLRWGLFLEKLELIADLQYQNETFTTKFSNTNKAALKQTVLGAKYLIYDPFKDYEKKINIYSWKANHAFNWDQFIPAVAVFAGANITSSNNPYYFSPEGDISPKIMLITQNHFGDGTWVFVTNTIADYIGTDYPSYGYVLTLTKGFNDKWSGFIENQGFKSDFYSDAIVRGGAAYLINKDMQIDASISSSLKNTPSILYGGIGISWRYDANYKEVRINLDNNDSDKKAKRKAKKTKKG
ncbi:transporter [Flavobacterium granuli]|uniref:Outer membrane putative beta-barrel porin/alpha-amylase n=1 Tax=Flavobacterium granuli TaxID=280093 RepID=A0A1M5IB47_9FLAO|nr:transporter [Flavobacterium granuli]PRZ27887.1 outer membrane putative beta-barrel porin/alpha-amylase [Flavobacterium granuli]SHG25467.1 Putative MetA-pathway of phenol degradation [Flavobacterium granuli]